MTIYIDGQQFINKDVSYQYLIRKLNLPSYTGHNLDALWDVLYDMDPLIIEVQHTRSIIENLDHYGLALLNVLGDIHNETTHTISFHW